MGLKAYSNMCESEHFRTCNGYVCQLKATEPVSIKRQSHSTPNCTLSVESTRTTSLCNPTVRYTALPFHPKRFWIVSCPHKDESSINQSTYTAAISHINGCKFILARSGQRGKTRQDLSSLRQEVRCRLVWSVKLANSILHAHFIPKFNVTLCHRLALIFAAGNIY